MLATLAPCARVSVDRTAPFLWYTLSVIPQSQARVCQRARELGIKTYTPMSRTPPALRKFGRQRVAEAEARPLMPGYVFVSLPTSSLRFDLFQQFNREADRPEPLPIDVDVGYVANKAWPTPEPIRGCLGFVSASDGPVAVSEAVIEDMRLRERNGEFDLTGKTDDGKGFVAKWVRVGAWVELVDGPFRLYRGIIEEVLSATLIKAAVTVFGRATPMTVPLDWVRLARNVDDALLISKKNRTMRRIWGREHSASN